MIKRTDTHRIDTRAVRTVLSQLDENWLVRNLDERDYGIDLQLEYFNEDNPTGYFTFIQLKGTTKSFEDKDENRLQFPIKTIEYALLFDVPFFVFYTSIVDNVTRFIWLQKYYEIELESQWKTWKEKDTIQLIFKKENDLNENIDHLISILRKDKIRKKGLKFLENYEFLKFHSDNVLNYEQFKVANTCNIYVENLLLLKDFISNYDEFNTDGESIFAFLSTLKETYQEIAETNCVTLDSSNSIRRYIERLDSIKVTLLYESDSEKSDNELFGKHPY